MRGVGRACDGRVGALRQKSGARRILPSGSLSALNGHPEVGGDGPALGLPCPLSSFRFLARRPFSPWVCFLFFYPLAQREGRGREKIRHRAQRALRRAPHGFARLVPKNGAALAAGDLNFIDYFASRRIKGGRGREFFGVFPIFFKKSIAKISSPPIILAFRE